MTKEPKDFIICNESGVPILASEKWEQDKPATFQWMPGGVTTICAHYSGKPIELTVNVTPNTAKAVQASFADWFRLRPKQAPFGCFEHKEQEAALRLPKDVAAFDWKDAEGDRDAGVYCTAVPTGLGARNVNEGVFASWSPSFTTDAEYHRAKVVKSASGRDFMIFPKGVRGSRENPAEVTGCAFSVGSLTNKPAFRNISPVKAVAEEAYEPEPEKEVEATWSDAAREAALKARNSHQQMAHKMREKFFAHQSSHEAFQASMNAHTEPSAYSHRNAANAHRLAAEKHHELGPEHEDDAAEHRAKVFEHEEHVTAFMKKENKAKPGPNKASESLDLVTNAPADLAAIYAKHAPAAELETIYAREPKDPLADLYSKLTAEPAGQS